MKYPLLPLPFVCLLSVASSSVGAWAQVDATTHNRMTNGSVARPPASTSHMTNGTAQKGSGTTLVVHYQDGAQTISVPPNVPVTEAAPAKMTLTQGDTIYVATTKHSNGPLTTDKILFIARAEPPNTAQ